MSRDLIVVRHGETDWNADGRLQGQTDIPLNARGRDQAAAVGRLIAAAPVDLTGRAFVASPLSRATETMRLMRAALGLPADDFRTDPRLKELSFGLWEGSTMAAIRERQPAAMRARDADRWSYRPPEGESYDDLAVRVDAALDEIEGPAVLVVHGGVSRALLHLLGGVPREKLHGMPIVQGRALAFDAGGWRWI
ncbi:phosphoglycerate mutase [Methylopila jiangsuensis]|uniref:Phosphoglycerate mutase n=1 Tax=Methylopila jiangsuensis TaxID=586230 RepID=A0A9W6JLV5_9HYPH|nr:histidine phosphatase family protein [Methylopila jiangsuensis]MDR6284415.1 putative phosphoglycerate mutase [Methylopila jiangsuensis]GLK78200.1 phosphoglycerate mutase [Methylopila jiangsuensis]